MLKKFFLPVLSLLILIISCDKENDSISDSEKLFNIRGNVQKGPFTNGSDISIYELSDNYRPTGRTFHTTTESMGQFELSDILIVSPYVELLADGFYFNEVAGELSNERITLKAIVDLTGKDSVNVNILTDLEYKRVKHLISESGLTITDAKAQAQNEILSVFSLNSMDITHPENLDISHLGDGDAVLLAVSAILQGNLTTAELSKLLADFVDDMEEDGILNDTIIQNSLLGQALTLSTDQIKENLLDKFLELGIDLEQVNHFEEYINHFISNTDYHFTSPFVFPVSTENGLNVLDPELLAFEIIPMADYSFAVDMPGAGKIQIRMHKSDGVGIWWYSPSQTYGWKVSEYNFSKNEQWFTSTINNDIIDLPMQFSEFGKAEVEYYYNGSPTPSFAKTISWGGQNTGDFIFQSDSPIGPNLLLQDEIIEFDTDTAAYTVGLRKSGNWDIHFILSYSEGISIEVPGGWGEYNFEKLGSQINFVLSGKDEGDYISEIIFNISGSGTMNLSSDDLEVEEGVFFNRSYMVN